MYVCILLGLFVLFSVVQIRQNILISLVFQIRHQYNMTAKYSNNTDSLTYRVTTAWDNIQNKVCFIHNTFYFCICLRKSIIITFTIVLR